jgi:hypothetical protein
MPQVSGTAAGDFVSVQLVEYVAHVGDRTFLERALLFIGMSVAITINRISGKPIYPPRQSNAATVDWGSHPGLLRAYRPTIRISLRKIEGRRKGRLHIWVLLMRC